MSVRPVAFPTATTVDVWHDDKAHGATVGLTAFSWGLAQDGTPERRYLVLTCPTCGDVSIHPIGGGCDAAGIQRLFVHRLISTTPTLTWVQAKSVAKALVVAMDGPDRWLLEQVSVNG